MDLLLPTAQVPNRALRILEDWHSTPGVVMVCGLAIRFYSTAFTQGFTKYKW